jgi:hypothetical protein
MGLLAQSAAPSRIFCCVSETLKKILKDEIRYVKVVSKKEIKTFKD